MLSNIFVCFIQSKLSVLTTLSFSLEPLSNPLTDSRISSWVKWTEHGNQNSSPESHLYKRLTANLFSGAESDTKYEGHIYPIVPSTTLTITSQISWQECDPSIRKLPTLLVINFKLEFSCETMKQKRNRSCE